jgi:hypothetical protein
MNLHLALKRMGVDSRSEPAKLHLDKCRSAEFARTRPVSHQPGPDKPLQYHFLQCPVGCQSFFKVDAIFSDLAE